MAPRFESPPAFRRFLWHTEGARAPSRPLSGRPAASEAGMCRETLSKLSRKFKATKIGRCDLSAVCDGDRAAQPSRRPPATQRGPPAAAEKGTDKQYRSRKRLEMNTAQSLLADTRGRTFHTVLADPPWRSENRTARSRPSTSGSGGTKPCRWPRSWHSLWRRSSRSRRTAISGYPTQCYPMGCRCSPPGIPVQGEPHLAQGAHGRGL